MFKGVGTLGTPSAPPIMNIGREGKSFTVETEIEQTGDEVCKSRESESFDGSTEGLADQTMQSMKTTEFVERYCSW